MSALPDVLRILDESLSMGGRALRMDPHAPLLGAVPELDSMAVVTLIGALESHFGIVLPDDELDAEVFATPGALADFVDAQMQR
nr:acyl carrier protein [Variovorax boronicumulans]